MKIGAWNVEGLSEAKQDAAIAVARDLREVNPSAVYEIRAISVYIPGAAIPMTEAVKGPG